MSQEFNEPTDVDNSDESMQESDPSGQSEADKFNGDYDKLSESYKNLEQKLGSNASDVQKMREEMDNLREIAQTAQQAAEALAARDGISKEEALKILKKESDEMLQKHAPEQAQREVDSKLKAMENKFQEMELLQKYPEANGYLDLVRDLAKSTGKPMNEIYEKRVMNLVPTDNSVQKQTNLINQVIVMPTETLLQTHVN